MKRTLLALVTLVAGLLANDAAAQCDTIATICEKHISAEFVPDGQFHRALLRDDENAEFDMTFFGGTTYRLAGCSGLSDGNLVFNVLDRERNVLFSNADHGSAPYWDLVIAHTVDVTIEARLDPSKLSSGCAVLLVGIRR